MKSSSPKPSVGKQTNQAVWSDGVKANGATKLLLEIVDRMVYATNVDRSIIFGNWSLDAKFGYLYSKPLRWDTRYRKFKEL